MSNQKVYMIDGAMYEDTVRERVMLYSFVRHLAYHAKRLSSQRDIRHLQEVAHLSIPFFSNLQLPEHYHLLSYQPLKSHLEFRFHLRKTEAFSLLIITHLTYYV